MKCLFFLLNQVGYPPFFSEEPATTCQKILHWSKTLAIPTDANLSRESIDLIKKLINDPSFSNINKDSRLGVNGVEEIKAHPFFFGIDWKRIRDKPSPWVPKV